MGRRRRRKIKLKPVFSAFIWGVLLGIGVDPGQMIFQAAWAELGPYLQFASFIILVIAIYFTYNSFIEAFERSKRAYRYAGVIGLAAIACAFLAGFFVFTGEKAIIVLVVAVLLWIVAHIK